MCEHEFTVTETDNTGVDYTVCEDCGKEVEPEDTRSFYRDEDSGRLVPASMELVRLAFLRRVYTQSHFDYILEGLADVAGRKEQLRGMRLVYDPPFLRHFTARFEPLSHPA